MDCLLRQCLQLILFLPLGYNRTQNLKFGPQIFRSNTSENHLNIEKKISLSRRTLYSLIKTGLRGCNGVLQDLSSIYHSEAAVWVGGFTPEP